MASSKCVEEVDYIMSNPDYIVINKPTDTEYEVMLLDAAFGQIPQLKQTIIIALDGFDSVNGLYTIVDLLPDMAIVERQDHTFEVGTRYDAIQETTPDREALVNAVMYNLPRFTLVTKEKTVPVSSVNVVDLNDLTNTEDKPEPTSDVVVDVHPLDQELTGFSRAYEYIRCVVM